MGAQRGPVFSPANSTSMCDFCGSKHSLVSFREMHVLDNHVQQAFGPASKSAIKCRIRSAVTQAEAAIATSLHR
jgi:hypothetical protein